MTIPKVPLGEFVEIKGGGTPSKSNAAFWGGDIPWVSPKDMKTWEICDSEDKITAEAVRESATNLIPPNATLIVNRSGILKHTLPVGITRRPVAINQDIKAILVSPRAHPEYVAHIIKAAEPIVLKWVRATTADNFPIDNLRELEVPLPPLDEQQRIATILDKADALRRKRKQAIELIQDVIRLAINDAFRDAGNAAQLGELCDVQGGLQLSRARANLPIEVPYLRVANVHRNRLDLSEVKTFRATQSEVARTALLKGDLLFVEGHGNADEIGRCAVWDGSLSLCSHQNHLIRARPLSDAIDGLAVSYWLNSADGRRHLLKRGKTTSGLNTISVSDVKATPVPLLEKKKRQKLRLELDKLITMQRQNDRQQMTFSSLFSSLQHRAFSGQL